MQKHLSRTTETMDWKEQEEHLGEQRVPNTRVRTMAYWVLTASLAVVMIGGAYGELTHQWGTLETHTILGYPLFFLDIIGPWKALAGITILIPGFARLKEWAYAGMFFNMTGAFLSHAIVGDYGLGAYHLIATGSIALLVVASWALRPPSRTLGKPTRNPLKQR